MSEAVKLLKADYLVKAINVHNMDQAIIFCRTKLDCDNVEKYLTSLGGGVRSLLLLLLLLIIIIILGSSKMVNEYSCVCLHGDRRPQERKDNLKAFKVFFDFHALSLSLLPQLISIIKRDVYLFLTADWRG